MKKEVSLDLSVELAPTHRGGLGLKNPVMAAAGTIGYGVEYSQIFDIQRYGKQQLRHLNV